MQTRYELLIQSTGEVIIAEESDLPARVWQGRKVRKLLRYKRTPARCKEAMLAGDIETGWANYDEFIRADIRGAELGAISDRVFKGWR